MRERLRVAGLMLMVIGCGGCRKVDAVSKGERFVAASDPALRFAGRWDLADPARPRASWPGFAVDTDFCGRAIQVRMTDAGNYFNVEIDGEFHGVVGGKRGAHLSYLLADKLGAGVHRLRLQRRNITFEGPTVIEGFVVDEAARLTRPAESGRRRIEFIGDSYTAAEGNEAVAATLPWKQKYPLTNFAAGFAARIGRALDAEVTAVCRSGSGLACDWKGGRKHAMGERYGWTLMENSKPAWTFSGPSPDLVVICLGLNDYSGLKGADGQVSDAASAEFRAAYRRLIAEVRRRHPRARLVALASFGPWARANIAAVVAAERADGWTGIDYAEFDEFPGGYVADGHPTVETHRKMAAQILGHFLRLGLGSTAGRGRDE